MTTASTTAGSLPVTVPEIGDFHDVPIIEIHVAEGDVVALDDPLITLESDKATMDVPAPAAGTVEQLIVKLGDAVNVGSTILLLATGQTLGEPQAEVGGGETPVDTAAQARDVVQQELPPERVDDVSAAARASAADAATAAAGPDGQPHAGPAVRRLARELDLDLSTIAGTGPKGRITKEDVRSALRETVPSPVAATGAGIPEIPAQDFSSFGPVETRPLPRIKTISGAHLHRSWLNVPHVTHDDRTDITDTDAYRKDLDRAARDEGYRVTLLAFVMKAVVSALRRFPDFNSSLSPDKNSLIVKSYYHLGIAVDTPNGLVVPVIRDVDRKGITELSKELGELSSKARDGKLTPAQMQGGTFTISSLGGIGGTSFTPIVNAPEVAILGVVRSSTEPMWDGTAFVPRLMLPVSLSYDHRVIDGAQAARFTRHLCTVLEDVRRLVL